MNTEVEPRFLSIENVLQAHDFSIERTGGSPGVRDLGLLQSALMMPQQQFGGHFLHEGFAGKAAAYLYHIAANHPFIDGNKRTATLAALAFLDINGIEPLPAPEELERVTWAIADGSMSKAELAAWFALQLGEPVPTSDEE
ncbi:MAG: type II toxin-antitoxin system death-on-curing family toxin [Armatimonadetes bacterium]|nr:type II toxin-antitoxin system death-on-curing family toxin [Armatimonadota bacterium]